MKGIKRKEVLDFIDQNKPDKTDDLVCDFLAGKKGASGHIKDAHANAEMWRDQTTGQKLELLTMSYLRSQKSGFDRRTFAHGSTSRWQGQVRWEFESASSADYDFSKNVRLE